MSASVHSGALLTVPAGPLHLPAPGSPATGTLHAVGTPSHRAGQWAVDGGPQLFLDTSLLGRQEIFMGPTETWHL